ncbi:MAG TPA: DUF2071 domain-containing protein, partial [Thermoanaerobaculia bacterium]|nr:DUF2071 domain-containing protein [Thermoanaerobaculia bacterium]
MTPPVFLTARWSHLAMLNWEVDRALLEPLLPGGVALDDWKGAHHVSAVGFLFLKTRVLGVAVPFCAAFEEVNLRFYVRRESAGGVRRGVVFVKELVPRRLVAFVARRVYHENYDAAPMSHEIVLREEGSPARVAYAWRYHGSEGRIRLESAPEIGEPGEGSREEFIVEHYRGYVRQPGGGTVEYAVEHPVWRVRRASGAALDGDVRPLWGERFAAALRRP